MIFFCLGYTFCLQSMRISVYQNFCMVRFLKELSGGKECGQKKKMTN